MKNALASAIKAAVTGKKTRAAMDDDEEVVVENEEETVDAEGDDEEVVAAGDDEEVEAEGDDEEVVAEGDDEDKPAAKGKAVSAAVKAERARCIAIVTHANADAQPKLTARLLINGTSRKSAIGMLNAVEASASGGSLASRYFADQGNKRPGVDGKQSAKPGTLLSTLAARKAARTQKGH